MSVARVIVLGGAGMLGHKMFQALRERFAGTFCTVRNDVRKPPFDRIELLQEDEVVPGVDVTDFPALEAILSAFRPEYVVNCVGLIKQRAEAGSLIPIITINSLLPHKLAQMAARWGGRIIHFSTDCVFNGKRGGYVEGDFSDAEDLYGKTKFLGEVAVANALTLRTSIIGRELTEHRSLLDWFLAQDHKTVRGYRRVIYSGVTTNHLAELAASIIREHPGLNGLYQVASEPISKYDLLCLLREAYQLDVRIEPDDLEVSDRSIMCDRLREAIAYKCPPWPVLARQLAEDNTPYEKWSEWK
jgi:dTDP-4-dehydrorhamnose reductase